MGFLRRGRSRPVYAPVVRVSRGEILSVWERYFERGLYHYGNGDYEDALADLDEAIANVNRNGELHATRGMILQQLGDHEAAEEDFDMALKLDPRQWVVYYLRAKRAYEQKKYDETIALATQASQFAPQRPEVLFLRGMSYYKRGELERALDDVALAVDSSEDPTNKSQRDLRKDMKKFQTQLKREVKEAKK